MAAALRPLSKFVAFQGRASSGATLDFYPTPPWAGRALIEHVLIGGGWSRAQLAAQVCWEPACGAGDLARGLAGSFAALHLSDIAAPPETVAPGELHDFLMPGRALFKADWIVTNPPFTLAAEFVRRGLSHARVGVALLVRTTFIEGIDRWRTIFAPGAQPPAIVAPFAERLPMVKGRLDPKASSLTSYSWLVWSKVPHHAGQTVVRWIPPCRATLERDGDYPAEGAS